MTRIIAVPSQYAVFKVPDETFELLPTGMKSLPPLLVLEVMVANGEAEKLATVGTITMGVDGFVDGTEEDDEDPPEGDGPWVSED